MTAEAPATRADVLREIARQVTDRGMPAPNMIDLGFEQVIRMHFDWSDQLDQWATFLRHGTRVSVHERDGVPSSWQYRNEETAGKWLGRSVHMLVIHDIPQGDDLIEQPVGGESR